MQHETGRQDALRMHKTCNIRKADKILVEGKMLMQILSFKQQDYQPSYRGDLYIKNVFEKVQY
jgi:hypothetical protein